MTRLARLCVAAVLAVTLGACAGGEGPGLDEDQGPAQDTAPDPQPEQSPIDEPDDSQPGTTY